VDFVEICNVCTSKAIIKAAKRISNSDKICRSYCDFYFGITFFGTQCIADGIYSTSCHACAHYDGQKQTKHVIFLNTVNTSDYM